VKKKPLSKTNPYLKDPKLAREMICRAVVGSFAIEGVRVTAADILGPSKSRKRSGSRAPA
jgi:hypothetical protein